MSQNPSSSKIRVAALSAWHVHAEEYARYAAENAATELIAVYDDDEARGRGLADKLGVEFTSDLDGLLARDDLDAVTITTATTAHSEVIGKAIAAGKHVFTEKLLAPTVAECDEIIAAAKAKNIALTVSLPRLFHGYTVALREMLSSGELGQLTYSRVRLAHNGSVADWLPPRFYNADETIGGAFSDLGAHPVYLTQLILGSEFTSVQATYTDVTGRGVEDNAVVTIATPSGAIGVIESGFVTGSSPFQIIVEGTKGGVVYGAEPGVMRVTVGGDSRTIEVPADAASPFERWVEAMVSGQPETETVDAARALTELTVAANAAAN